MSKVFAQLQPEFENEIVSVEVDVNTEENFSLLDRYEVMTIPTSILIDSNGSIQEKFSGYYSPEQMKEKLKNIK